MDEMLFGEPDKADMVVQALWRVPGWPKDQSRDRQFALQLMGEFPSLHLPNEIKAWQVWLLDHPEVGGKKKVNWRSRFRTWCKNGVTFGRERREQQGSGLDRGRIGSSRGVAGRESVAVRSGGARPGTEAEHGPTRRLDDW